MPATRSSGPAPPLRGPAIVAAVFLVIFLGLIWSNLYSGLPAWVTAALPGLVIPLEEPWYILSRQALGGRMVLVVGTDPDFHMRGAVTMYLRPDGRVRPAARMLGDPRPAHAFAVWASALGVVTCTGVIAASLRAHYLYWRFCRSPESIVRLPTPFMPGEQQGESRRAR